MLAIPTRWDKRHKIKGKIEEIIVIMLRTTQGRISVGYTTKVQSLEGEYHQILKHVTVEGEHKT